MIRLKRNNLSVETKNLIKDVDPEKIVKCPPVLAKGCEPSRGLRATVIEAKKKFKYGE